MKAIFKIAISSNSELPDEQQTILDNLNRLGRRFNVEEYYNDNISVYVTKEGIYLFTTKENAKTKVKGRMAVNLITYNLIKVDSIKELYEKIRGKRSYLELHEVKIIIDSVEIFAKQIGLVK